MFTNATALVLAKNGYVQEGVANRGRLDDCRGKIANND